MMALESCGGIWVDVQALQTARRLRDAFCGRIPGGIFGVQRTMPEEEAVRDIKSPLDRIRLITMIVAIDYQRDAEKLWDQARRLFSDERTRWVYDPFEVMRRGVAETRRAIESKGKLRYGNKDADWWHHNAKSWAGLYQGDPRILFEQAFWKARVIGQEVRKHGRFKGLGGCKIFPLWLRMMADIEQLRFDGIEQLSIPVDVHIARSTFTVGILRGSYQGSLGDSFRECIRNAWRTTCEQYEEAPIAFDEALWHLSRLGCTYRHKGGSKDCPRRAECPVGANCPTGIVRVSSGSVTIST